MTKGFVTIATGQERYFELARNLLRSYRLFASEKYPFAIICDKKNQYTEEFDDVILLDHAYCNYLDKLQLYEYLPYDETIFIDADSLAYGGLDEWWHIFRDADDFSLFGYMWTNLDSGRGWFVPSGLKEYQNQVTFISDFNGGIYYMRRGEICKEYFGWQIILRRISVIIHLMVLQNRQMILFWRWPWQFKTVIHWILWRWYGICSV